MTARDEVPLTAIVAAGTQFAVEQEAAAVLDELDSLRAENTQLRAAQALIERLEIHHDASVKHCAGTGIVVDPGAGEEAHSAIGLLSWLRAVSQEGPQP